MIFRWFPAALMSLAVLASVSARLPAQVPGVPAAPALPGAAAAPGAAGAAAGATDPTAAAAGAAPAAAPANNLWSFLCPSPAQLAACKQKLCASPLAQFFGSALAPARALSGGLMPTCCPVASPADLAAPADSPEGAAARIKEREAQAKKRRADVRYLGTVDCRRYPEAEAALVGALRGDENECVRWEAAMALGRGCCCTRKVLQALVDTVSGKKTNDPAETSERVKLAAQAALEHCLMRYCEVETGATTPPEAPPAERPEVPPEPGAAPARLPPAARLAPDPLVEEARRVLARRRTLNIQPVVPAPAATAEPVRLSEPPVAPPAGPIILTASARPPETPVAAAPAPVEQPATTYAPPRGSRDVWSVLRAALRDPK
jgi:hypothetical protein